MKQLTECRRILVIGSPGAGKSALARRLASSLSLPLVHLDQNFWNPGWVPSETSAWDARVAELVAGDEWVMDGNYARTLPMRLERAEAAIFLDYDRTTCLTGALQRILEFAGQSRPDLPADCPERVDWGFLRWVWNFQRDVGPQVMAMLDDTPHLAQVRLRDRDEAERWLAGLIDRPS